MARLSVNETTTFRWSFEDDVVGYAAAGIPAMGVWRQKLSDFGEARGQALLAERGLEVSHLLWAGGFTGSDGRSYRASVEDAREAIRTAATLKAGCLVVYSGGRASHTHNHAKRLFKQALGELAPVAAEAGVVLAVEPMHRGCCGEFTFLTTIDDVLGMLDEVGNSSVGMVLDTYHLGFSPDLIERIPQFIERVAIVQLGDARRAPSGEPSRCLLGEGVIPLGEIVGALRAAGYDGYYDVELLGEELEQGDYRVLLDHAKGAYARLVGNS